MDRNQTQTAGDYDLGQVAILGSSGNPVNITQLIQEINIFQIVLLLGIKKIWVKVSLSNLEF